MLLGDELGATLGGELGTVDGDAVGATEGETDGDVLGDVVGDTLGLAEHGEAPMFVLPAKKIRWQQLSDSDTDTAGARSLARKQEVFWKKKRTPRSRWGPSRESTFW